VAVGLTGFAANVADFVNLSGNLGFKKSGSNVIAVGSDVTAALEAGAVSVSLADADFGLQASDGKTAFELKNGAFSASIGDSISVTATSVVVQYTDAASVAAGTTLTVGSTSYTFEQAIGANTIAFRGVATTINILDLVSVSGGFGVEKKTNQTLYVSGAAEANQEVTGANLLTVGLADVSAFVGFSGIGLNLTDVDLAIALWSENIQTNPRSWTSVKASVGSATFTGVSGLEIRATNVGIVVNRKASDNTVVDYKAGTGETAQTVTELTVTVAPSQTVAFDIDDVNGDYTQVVGQATINVFGMVSVTGGFGVEKKTGQSVVVSNFATPAETRSTVTANLLTIGLSDVDAFVGFGGVGLDLDGVDLAIALWSEDVQTNPRSWTTVMGSVASASFAGVEGLTISVTSVGIVVNKKASDNTVADYSQTAGEASVTSLTVTVSPGQTVSFNIDDNNSFAIYAGGGGLGEKTGGFGGTVGGEAVFHERVVGGVELVRDRFEEVETDPMSRLNPPVANTTVSIQLPAGKSKARAWALTAESWKTGDPPRTQAVPLDVRTDGGRATATVPEVLYWKMVVWRVE
jgi:hypothetical protein